MSRTTTLHSSTRSAVAERLDSWSDQTQRLEALQRDLETKAEALERTQAQTVESLAQALLPVARAMATLTEETRRTLERIEESSQDERRQMAKQNTDQVAKADMVADKLSAAMLRAEATMQTLTTAMQQASERQVNPWGPALLVALPSLVAILWLSWKVGALRL